MRRDVWRPCLLLIVITITVAAASAQQNASAEESLTIAISRETTFVTSPKRADGFVDIAAAIERQYRRGVTRENNAVVPLLEALGPRLQGVELPPEAFAKLEMPPPAGGEYYVSFSQYMKSTGVERDDPRWDEAFQQFDRALAGPWQADELPHVAAWLDSNERALEKIAAAVERPRFFMPFLLDAENFAKAQGLVGALLPVAQASRYVAQAWIARAMLRCAEGDGDAAWRDLLRAQRLGRLTGQGPTVIEALVGVAIGGVANRATVTLLRHESPDAATVERRLAELRALPPLPDMAERVHIFERMQFVDCVLLMTEDDELADQMLSMGAEELVELKGLIAKPMLRQVDWNAAMRVGHGWFDKLVAALRKETYRERADAIAAHEQEFKAFRNRCKQRLAQLAAGAPASPQEAGEFVGETLVLFLLTSASVDDAENRALQEARNAEAALALAAYHSEHGEYPQRLEQLSPTFLPAAPIDLFAGAPVQYQQTAAGYRLYSVGPNGQDDGGANGQGDSPEDDLLIEISSMATRSP